MTKYVILIGIILPLELFASTSCRGASHYVKCLIVNEQILLSKNSAFMSRNKEVLNITPTVSKPILYKNLGGVQYIAVDYIQPAASILLMFFTGNHLGGYIVVDTKYGKETVIHGHPTFNHDYSQFVSVNYDLEAGFAPNDLSIYKKTSLLPWWHLAYYSLPETWGAQNPKWITDELIVFDKVTLNESFEYVQEKYSLTFFDGTWRLQSLKKLE